MVVCEIHALNLDIDGTTEVRKGQIQLAVNM